MTGKIVFDMFSEERIELMKETNRHPPLVIILNRVPDAAWEEQLAMICAYCYITVDGYYTQEELERLYGILFGKLQDMRAVALHMGGATPFASSITGTKVDEVVVDEIASEPIAIDESKPDEGEIVH